MTAPAVSVCGVVLAAGEGQRLRPLTAAVPKALCPVGNLPLLDHALRRLAGLGLSEPDQIAVNAAYLADQVVTHVGARAHLSVEPDGPLGTSGGVGRLKSWIDGRGVLVGNADAYLVDPARKPGEDIAALLDGWDGETVRMLTKPCFPGVTGGFSGHRFAGFSLLPWRYVRDLDDKPENLVRTVWRPAEAEGALELIGYQGFYLDTGTPADYLAANLHAAGATDPALSTPDSFTTGTDLLTALSSSSAGLIDTSAVVNGRALGSVVGAGACVDGQVTHSVVWPGAVVEAGESLTGVVRARDGLTIPVL
ncbi:sugar phosphate nucleotidyltransferase [Actinoplanes rectilineatus]|uniref:sugar phosphate nucleotidyltransferase n=1 Tax=Actinoplanes rectilineatus TaxID=113571 RepID=UPI0005F29BDD|nr:sugar phosphate nucleotidyltransferase [Actinoplanes rectilineatus]